MSTTTPLMQQYLALKKDFKDTLLFFQVGDFYEFFFDDAKKAATFLGITLTKRGNHKGEPIPLCGVPVHALDHYLVKLIKGGFKVAIADQLTEAKPGSLVERGISRVLTPGTLTDSHLLDEKSASYLFSFYPLAERWGFLFGELLTAQLFATELTHVSERTLEAEVTRFFPDEILIPHTKQASSFIALFKRLGYAVTVLDPNIDELINNGTVRRWMHKQFNADVRRTVENHHAIRYACASLYTYLHKNQSHALEQFNQIQFYQPQDYLIIDSATQRNLELVKNNQTGSRKNTLLSVIDGAVTGMGSRMIKKWLLRPFRSKESIVQRQDAIQTCKDDLDFQFALKKLLQSTGDIERVIGRICLGRASVQDYATLLSVLLHLPELAKLLERKGSIALLNHIKECLEGFESVKQLLCNAINSDASLPLIIKKGFNKKLDTQREYSQNSNAKIIALEKSEQQKTRISSLKVRYNKVHGYYIEVTKANLKFVPDYYIRQQTLVGKERFIIHKLQELQHTLISAQQQVQELELKLFEQVKGQVRAFNHELRKLAHALAHLDAVWGLAHIAYEHNYVRPTLNEKCRVAIIGGRHPVIETHIQAAFITNDTQLDDTTSFLIITGPNMGGKSTYLRQVALIAILAHIGSFVPAEAADIALLDRVFTRVGAGDNLAEGKSTFLVEMEETAAICNEATKSSLVILDEVGRGTSTYDGLAIAHAVVEYLYTYVKARCLFATHYHELHSLSGEHSGIASFYAASKETHDGIILLHTIVPGVAKGSFGIQVAKVAGLPEFIIQRSTELLAHFSEKEKHPSIQTDTTFAQKEVLMLRKQLNALHKKYKQLDCLDYDTLSPKKAFDILWDWKE